MEDILFYSAIAVILLFPVIAYFIYRHKKNERLLKAAIKKRWGTKPSEKFTPGELKSISSYFYNKKELNKSGSFIDDITWNDLDMDQVFKRTCSTYTTVGDEYLYALLREPLTEEAPLSERDRLLSFFRDNPKERLEVQYRLARLGRKKYVTISDYFLSGEKSIPTKGSLYLLLLGILVFSPLVFFLSIGLGILLVISMLVTNVIVYIRTKNELSIHLEALSYIVNMIGCATKIEDLGIKEIGEYNSVLGKSLKSIKGLSSSSFYSLFYRTEDPVLEYVKVVFLGELIAFDRLFKNIYRHRHELRKVYEIVGFLDSMLSIASYRESLPFYSKPALYKTNGKLTNKLLFSEMYHPLITEPVTNSSEFARSVLVTGSNASGKSTFLKTVALNALFAQTIGTCLAKEYSSCFFLIYTSMALKDDIESSESYYMAEIKSLKRIFDNLNAEIPCLCIVDEVLRGTNTIERISASSEVLYSLSRNNCLVLAATHDLELTSILGKHFDNFHFQEYFSEKDIVFDYRLYPGKSSTRNAIKLLKLMGYDEGIVKTAEERAGAFTLSGNWKEID